MYPLLSKEKPMAYLLAVPPKSDFCVHTLVTGSYSQKSFLLEPLVIPVPIYPLLPMEKPTAPHLAVPPKSDFCFQESGVWLFATLEASKTARTKVNVFIFLLYVMT